MSWNYCGLVFGPPEAGKTSIAVEVADKFLAEGVKLFAHDPNKQFRGRAAEYPNAAAWEAAAAKAAAANDNIAAGSSFGCDAEEVRDLMVRLGKRWNDVDNVRVKMLGIFDEGSLLSGSGSTYIGKDDQALLANRRHYGIGLLFLMQRTTMLTDAFKALATDVYIMQTPAKRLPDLEESLNLPAGALARVAELPPHRYVHVRLGIGAGCGISKERV